MVKIKAALDAPPRLKTALRYALVRPWGGYVVFSVSG